MAESTLSSYCTDQANLVIISKKVNHWKARFMFNYIL